MTHIRPSLPNQPYFQLRDPGSAITHFIGFVCATLALFPLLIRASMVQANLLQMIGLSVFMLSMMLLYGASTLYHAVHLPERQHLLLRRLDHLMIFVLIAGSYTPVCILALHSRSGYLLLVAVWCFALAGAVVQLCWINGPKWLAAAIYITMGWLCIFALPQIVAALTGFQFGWLLAGGIFYTVGGVIYALKLRCFAALPRNFGNHEIFHVFVMAGSFCHYCCIYNLLQPGL